MGRAEAHRSLRMRLVAVAAGGLAAALLCPAGRAEQLPLWEVGAGVAYARLPDYRGSDEAHGYVLPFPYLVYRGDFFKADREGMRALFFSSKYAELDFSAGATVPVNSTRNRARAGMPDLRPTVAGGRWNLGLLAGGYFGDRRYHDYFYGVAPQFATAERPAYAAPGGFGGWQAIVALSATYGKTWIGAFVKADWLRGAVFDDSPLVRRSTNLSGGLGVSHVFTRAERLIEVPR
jgi:outer membrane protein